MLDRDVLLRDAEDAGIAVVGVAREEESSATIG
jgi:hypothetical protein